MKIFGWKCTANLSDTKYVELQEILEEEKVPIETLSTTRQYLQKVKLQTSWQSHYIRLHITDGLNSSTYTAFVLPFRLCRQVEFEFSSSYTQNLRQHRHSPTLQHVGAPCFNCVLYRRLLRPN